MKEFTDSEIIECLRNRQSYVVGYLTDRYLPMIRLMVRDFGGDSDDARDTFQEALMIILTKIDKQELTLTCRFSTFLYCICENLCRTMIYKRVRAENYRNSRMENTEEEDFEGLIDNKMYRTILREVFESLDPAEQTIFKLYLEDYSPVEIAEKLGLSYNYVRKKKCDAQTKLVSRIRNHPEYLKIKESEAAARNVVL